MDYLYLGVQQSHTLTGINQLLLSHFAAPLGLLQGCSQLLDLSHDEVVPALHHGHLLSHICFSSEGVIKVQYGILRQDNNKMFKTVYYSTHGCSWWRNYRTLSCPWTVLSCFWASEAWRLAWLSWISISLRSPSIFSWFSALSLINSATFVAWHRQADLHLCISLIPLR